MQRKIFYILFGLLTMVYVTNAQAPAPEDWMHYDQAADGMQGISSAKAYKDFLGSKQSTPVIVAILDSGIDVEHEDLRETVWVNVDEIPNNGIDDDKNGYIDDINGWNFIGGANEDVHHETYEVTRLYGKYKSMYENVDVTKMSTKEKKAYTQFLVYKDEVESKREKAQANLDQIESTRQAYHGALKAVKSSLGVPFALPDAVAQLEAEDQNLVIGKNILTDVFKEYTEGIDIDTLLFYIDSDLDGASERDRNQLEYAYNPDFNSRKIIGDNYQDQNERIYGNNGVEGPDALHGTHVAGIVGALRDNGIGMDGVANNVRLMSVRCVPDGDEHDKDVANAIRYAVDNGASIINMSFGKGFSWNKDVVDEAVQYAVKNDVLLVHAAGNSAENIDNSDNFPNDTYKKAKGFLFWKKKKADSWLSVGALNYQGGENAVAPFSNYGKQNVDLFAPGMAIYSALPDDEYRYLQGTSMASPVVAGAAAVLRSYFPKLSAKQVKSILMESVAKLDREVVLPGNKDKKVAFSELSATGGVLNLHKAIQLASRTKGKRKIKSKRSNNKV